MLVKLSSAKAAFFSFSPSRMLGQPAAERRGEGKQRKTKELPHPIGLWLC